jgi:hypothetical protein
VAWIIWQQSKTLSAIPDGQFCAVFIVKTIVLSIGLLQVPASVDKKTAHAKNS